MVAPCKNCENRKLHCHSFCEKYIEYRKLQEKVYSERIKEGIYNEVKHERMRRTRQGLPKPKALKKNG